MGQGGKISLVDKVIVVGITVTDKEQIQGIFNVHFVSVGSKIADNVPATDLSPTVEYARHKIGLNESINPSLYGKFAPQAVFCYSSKMIGARLLKLCGFYC